MAKTMVQKILESHLVSGRLIPGEEIGIRIDQTLTQDATGTMAYLQFEAMKVARVKTELSVSYVDHNTLQDGFENADDHRYLETVAAKHGILYSRAGNGICHQVHLERFGRPGKSLLGADSHTPTGGGIGMFAIGAGGLDVAVAMAGGPFYLTCPRVTRINLHGKLRPWVSAKDVILRVLEILTTKGNVGTVIEYGGEGVLSLDVPERATITNMGAELGVTTSLFPSDEVTRTFLAAQGREEQWIRLEPDPGASYDRVIDIDLSKLEPRVACPHSPDNVRKVSELSGLKVDQVLIGSCTNASYRDIMICASALKGKKTHPRVSFGVACGSRQVFDMVAGNGALSILIAAGARILEPACGFCIGNGQAPQTGAVSIRTNNRNFEGRSGTRSAGVYLTSPETAVAAALAGYLVDPTEWFAAEDYPTYERPTSFLIDDSMILQPSDDPDQLEIFRGPNIGEPPSNDRFPDTLDGEVAIKVGDKITTDHIMPAGARLKYRSNIPKYSTFVFEGVDPTFAQRAAEARDRGTHGIVVGGLSYGQGSSREHAALCPMYLGVKAVIVKSLERIHRANLINAGILPLTFADSSDYDKVSQGHRLVSTGIKDALLAGSTSIVVKDMTNESEFRLTCDLSERERAIVAAGGLLNYTAGAADNA